MARVSKKVKFDAVAAAARADTERDVPERKYFSADADEACVSQFNQLPVEYQAACVEGALPLEYVGEDWLMLVITGHWGYESGYVIGNQLHKNWEDTKLDHMSLQTVQKMRGGYLPVSCPNGSYLAVKILGVYE
jgi:hypothetical protein